MSEESKNVVATTSPENFGIMLPCSQEEFTDFISGLLGKAQTIEKRLITPFEINKDNIMSIYYLVHQRITQQNHGNLVQFTVRIIYDDGTSVTMNSLTDFQVYNEVHPLTPRIAVLSWTYLIKFQNKPAPEKQEIEVVFQTGRGDALEGLDGMYPFMSTGIIRIKIDHSARSWGMDIESLLSKHLEEYKIFESDFKRWIVKNSEIIGVAFGLIVFLMSLVGSYLVTNYFSESQLISAKEILANNSNQSSFYAEKINYLITTTINGAWPRYMLGLTNFILISVIVAIFVAAWTGSAADNREKSYILLTKKATEEKERAIKSRNKKWLSLISSIISGILLGLVSNYIFAKIYIPS